MLTELARDYALLVPGEVIEHVAGGRRTTVYPPGVYHLGTAPGMYAAVRAAADDGAARIVLLGEAFPLLAGCCSPRLADRSGPLAELAADSWLRQSADLPDDDGPPDRRPGGRPSPPPTFSEVLAVLVDAGHRVDDVLRRPQAGLDGVPLPYPGWTLPQLAYHWRATQRMLADHRAEALSGTMAGIAGTFGDDDARDAVADRLRRLRAIAEGGRRAHTTAAVADAPDQPTPEELAALFPRMAVPPRPDEQLDEPSPNDG